MLKLDKDVVAKYAATARDAGLSSHLLLHMGTLKTLGVNPLIALGEGANVRDAQLEGGLGHGAGECQGFGAEPGATVQPIFVAST